MSNPYEPPAWCAKPAVGLHLDVMKDGKMVQKFMIDEKKCYLFGRNPKLNDFCIDHASCSRVHAALLYHKILHKSFLVDLGSTHGTFVGSIRLESQKPTQLPIDSQFHFGASTRSYVLRERPQTMQKVLEAGAGGGERGVEHSDFEGGLLGLPETENELDNLTEFNTAHNKRITMLGIDDMQAEKTLKRKQKLCGEVRFCERDEIINPEDIDPSVGRFRNLVRTAVIPSKKMRLDGKPAVASDKGMLGQGGLPTYSKSQSFESYKSSSLYGNLDDEGDEGPGPHHSHHVEGPSAAGGEHHNPHHNPAHSSLTISSLGMSLPNPAPDVDLSHSAAADSFKPVTLPVTVTNAQLSQEQDNEPRKKKYAKEAWPGKKPSGTLLV